MIVYRMRSMILLVAAIALTVVLAGASGASAAVPVKLTFTSQFGREVNLTQTEAKGGAELEDICTVASKDECKAGTESGEQSGFRSAESVAVMPTTGDVYVADDNNARIQEFSASGQFVRTFGKEVNETNGSDICTVTEKCKAGVPGDAPGQFEHPCDVAVNSANGNVWVGEAVFGQGPQGNGAQGERVQKFSGEGFFLLEIGQEVNEATKGNLCTHVEEEMGVKCTGPALREFGVEFSPQDGSFDFETGLGDLLVVGAGGKLYVGDQGRVQEFAENGQFSEEVALEEAGTRVDALALDGAGDLYLTNNRPGTLGKTVRELEAKGNQLKSFEVRPEVPEAEVRILGLALDGNGHLAVAAIQGNAPLGSLYEASTGVRLTSFRLPAEGGDKGITFNGSNQLYVATGVAQKVLQYTPKIVAALETPAISPCPLGASRETDVTVNCTLTGEVDPEGVSETEAWFEWGRGSVSKCELVSMTPKQALSTVSKVEPLLEGLRPNETYCYKFVAEDENAKAPEPLETELTQFTTELAPPRILEVPLAQFVKASSAVMVDQLNPENAQTTYYFEYAPGQKALPKCASNPEECFPGERKACGAARTPLRRSAVYGSIGVSSEAVGLQPGTEYSYRLVAENEKPSVNPSEEKEKCLTSSGEASFTTATVPSPTAATGGYSAPGATSTVVYATVTPDGAPVTYSFELGVYEGAGTQFGVVSSGNVEASSGPVVESLALTGLQPGTTYAYRIAIASGYIDNPTHTLKGQTATFITGGLPAVLPSPLVLAQLPVPQIAFPKAAASKPKAKAKGKAKKKKKRGKGKKGKKALRSSVSRPY